MPFIFPKRFLRPRDILDPTEFNQDTEPVQALLDGEVDRHHFQAGNLKASIKLHPDDVDTRSDTNVSLDEGAYFTSHYESVELPMMWGRMSGEDPDDELPSILVNHKRKTPNFVTPDGATFRDASFFTGSAKYANYADNLPSIIPNNGSWSSVKTGDLSDSMKLTVTTGQANLYINAFVQYVWQGFYESKVPWKYEGPDADSTKMGWNSAYGEQLPMAEANCLNANGPTSQWLYWPRETDGNFHLTGYDKDVDDVYSWSYSVSSSPDINLYCESPHHFPYVADASYSYPLNELSATEELKTPQLGGYHHISKGFYPALVQFAIRIDGKIVDETVTGKDYQFEESAHGLRVEDSHARATTDGKRIKTSVSGQRAHDFAMSYGYQRGEDTAGNVGAYALPGQKIRSSRAAACGPEVLPVRIGAVIPVSPGTHTIEIVARRLGRKRKTFEYGDFVGVFSRRLHTMVLPISPTHTDVPNDDPPVQTKILQSENLIERDEEVLKFESLRQRINSLRPSDIKKRSLPNTHLPSKVKYWSSVGWAPDYMVHPNRVQKTGLLTTNGGSRFPGWSHSWNIDRRTYGNWYNDYRDEAGGKWTGAGWQLLVNSAEGGQSLRIADADQLKLADNEELLIFADIEVRNLISSGQSQDVRDLVADIDAGLWADWHSSAIHSYLSFVVDSKYLDLFGLLAVGYRTGSDEDANWTIASKQAPAVINSSNWVNRDRAFLTEYSSLVERFSSHGGGDVFTDGSDYGFTDLDPKKKDMRGLHTQPGNIGITVPIFLRLTKDDFATDAESELTEVAIFASTTFPSDWDSREATKSLISGNKSSGGIGGHESRHLVEPSFEHGTTVERGGGEVVCHNSWASPWYGRAIIDGARFNFGRGRLTVIKLVK